MVSVKIQLLCVIFIFELDSTHISFCFDVGYVAETKLNEEGQPKGPLLLLFKMKLHSFSQFLVIPNLWKQTINTAWTCCYLSIILTKLPNFFFKINLFYFYHK